MNEKPIDVSDQLLLVRSNELAVKVEWKMGVEGSLKTAASDTFQPLCI